MLDNPVDAADPTGRQGFFEREEFFQIETGATERAVRIFACALFIEFAAGARVMEGPIPLFSRPLFYAPTAFCFAPISGPALRLLE